jgi:hypothetical protein
MSLIADLPPRAWARRRPWVVLLGLAVAVGMTGGQATAAATELVITCTDDGTLISSPSVPVASDGVHVRVVLSGSVLHDVQIDDAPGAVYLTTDQSVPYVVDVAPGVRKVTCFDPASQQPGTAVFDARTVTVDVTDPTGLYVSPRLQCTGATVSTFADPPAIIDRRRLRFALRAQMWGIRSTDVAEFAGYPTARNRNVRIRRGSTTIATVQYSPDGHGRYVMGQVNECWSLHRQAVGLAGSASGLAARLYVRSTLDRTPIVLSVTPAKARPGMLRMLRARHAIICRTPRGTLVATTRMSSIDRMELTFLRKVDSQRATRWRCEVRSSGRVIGRIGISAIR